MQGVSLSRHFSVEPVRLQQAAWRRSPSQPTFRFVMLPHFDLWKVPISASLAPHTYDLDRDALVVLALRRCDVVAYSPNILARDCVLQDCQGRLPRRRNPGSEVGHNRQVPGMGRCSGFFRPVVNGRPTVRPCRCRCELYAPAACACRGAANAEYPQRGARQDLIWRVPSNSP